MFAGACGGDQSDIEVVQGAYTHGPIQLGSAHGGGGGTHFNVSVSPMSNERLAEWRIWSGTEVNALQIVYRDNWANYRYSAKVGGSSGQLQPPLLVAPSDMIVQVGGRSGAVNDAIWVALASGGYVWGGGNGGQAWGPDYTLAPPLVWPTYELGGITVNYGNAIDKIWFYQYQQ
jgi:hypothetical protein